MANDREWAALGASMDSSLVTLDTQFKFLAATVKETTASLEARRAEIACLQHQISGLSESLRTCQAIVATKDDMISLMRQGIALRDDRIHGLEGREAAFQAAVDQAVSTLEAVQGRLDPFYDTGVAAATAPGTCVVCRERSRSVTFLPCHHLVACRTCVATAVSRPEPFSCFVCRTPVATLSESILA